MLQNTLTPRTPRKRSYTFPLESHTNSSAFIATTPTNTSSKSSANTSSDTSNASSSKSYTQINKKKKMTSNNNNYIIVLDTETTGLFSRNSNPEDFELFNCARIVEIAWEIYTPEGQLVNKESYIIKPHGFSIPDSAIAIHGISNEEAQSTGIQLTYVFDRLLILLKDVSTIVAHNFSYDNAIILAELYRHNFVSDGLNKYTNLIEEWMSKNHKCTMTMEEVNIKLNLTVKKWHKLIDLYRLCFNKEPECELHRAAADVSICAQIYFHLIKNL